MEYPDFVQQNAVRSRVGRNPAGSGIAPLTGARWQAVPEGNCMPQGQAAELRCAPVRGDAVTPILDVQDSWGGNKETDPE